VSVPDSTALPECARRVDLALPDGLIAALEAVPQRPAEAAALLVPGFTGSKEDFVPLLAPLADAGVRVLAVDQRGQCDTPGLADPAGYAAHGPDGAGFGTSVFGSEIRALAGSLAASGAGPVHLLGHSFGGHAVREALLGAAPSDSLPVASITFLDSGPAAVTGTESRDRLELLLSVEHRLTPRQIHELIPVDTHPDPRVREFLLHRWLSNDPASLFAIARRLLAEPDRTPELRTLLDVRHLRCLVVAGADEDVWSADLLRETASRLGAQFALIPDAGHSPNTQQPAALVKTLVEFWLG
jgi:pimeloyl-ACP methyl ester carboxylesterase